LSFYLDTSVIVSLFLDEPRTSSVAGLIADGASPILISEFGVGEFSAAISTAIRMDRLSDIDGIAILEDFDTWCSGAVTFAAVTSADLKEAIEMVRRFDLKLLFPDALHIATCRRLGAALVSGDRRQAEAAAMLGIDVALL
jgi:predicted nucleic acid-binding protein